MTSIRPRFSLFQLLEVVTLIAMTIAVDRVIGGLVGPAVVLMGGVTGAYLAFRWTAHRAGRWDDIWWAIGSSAAATFLNVSAVGIVIVEQARRATNGADFDWARDGASFATAIALVTLGGTVVGTLLFAVARLIVAVHNTKPS